MFFYYFSITKLSTLFWIIFANNFFCSYNSRLLVFGVRPKLNKNVKKRKSNAKNRADRSTKIEIEIANGSGVPKYKSNRNYSSNYNATSGNASNAHDATASTQQNWLLAVSQTTSQSVSRWMHSLYTNEWTKKCKN